MKWGMSLQLDGLFAASNIFQTHFWVNNSAEFWQKSFQNGSVCSSSVEIGSKNKKIKSPTYRRSEGAGRRVVALKLLEVKLTH